MMLLLIVLAFALTGEPELITDTPFVQIVKFDDRMVIVIPNGVKFNLTFQEPVDLEVSGTDDKTYFVSLPKSEVFHLPTCYLVKDRTDAIRLIPEQAIMKRPCYFCKPTEIK